MTIATLPARVAERGDPWRDTLRHAAVAGAPAGPPRARHGRRAGRRALAARLSQDAQRAAPGGAEPGEKADRSGRESRPLVLALCSDGAASPVPTGRASMGSWTPWPGPRNSTKSTTPAGSAVRWPSRPRRRTGASSSRRSFVTAGVDDEGGEEEIHGYEVRLVAEPPDLTVVGGRRATPVPPISRLPGRRPGRPAAHRAPARPRASAPGPPRHSAASRAAPTCSHWCWPSGTTRSSRSTC